MATKRSAAAVKAWQTRARNVRADRAVPRSIPPEKKAEIVALAKEDPEAAKKAIRQLQADR